VKIGPLLDELNHNVKYFKVRIPPVISNNEPDPENEPFHDKDAAEFVSTVANIVRLTFPNETGFVV
jgi:hypothetical protein